MEICKSGGTQALQGQLKYFKIGFKAGMAVYFSAELQGLACGVRTGRQGVYHRAAITKPGDSAAVEQMRVYAGDLRRGVYAQAQTAAA